ncbi:hypothetical protein TNCV_3300661 [Trichonephila clavipes]|nr:hypothetical protein TNCV_3300661 [Trichonephila clavipes]
MRRGHNKENQFEPQKPENITTAPTSVFLKLWGVLPWGRGNPSKQGQSAGIPEEEVVNNRIARRRKEERTATVPSPWRSYQNAQNKCKRGKEFYERKKKENQQKVQSEVYISPGSLVAIVITFIHKVLVLYAPEAAAIIEYDDDKRPIL